MKTRRSKFDILFSKLVRERAGWTCEVCGKRFEENAANLHCSHFFSRRKQSTRFDPQNCASHCFTCHQSLGENPWEFANWIRKHLGNEEAKALKVKAETILKRSKKDKQELYEKMKSEHARMLNERASGVEGRLEFELA